VADLEDTMTLNGIDVSAAGQGASFNWNPYKGKLGFAGVKISEGTGYADPDAGRNIAGARSIGAVPMGYHFLHAGQPGAQQAEFFLSHAKAAGLGKGCLIAIDAEDGGLDGLGADQLDQAAAEFCAELKKHFGPRYWPELYTEISIAPHMTSMGNCPLWLANPSGMVVKSIGPWKQVSMEQTGQRGVDTDVFYGTAADLAKLTVPA
jgi:GH25 family lysozyme M1 (1,4-beta-N-acetylmuramidase)